MTTPRLELAFLWHMHQPPYRDPDTGELILPWVRLHATRAYLDMAEIHRRFPEVKSTVNFVPSLLDQLDSYASGQARDRFLTLTVRRPEDMSEDERVFVLRNFFMVSWEQGVRPLPRYWELLHKRGRELAGLDLRAVARSFGAAELRDIQTLFNLAWMGFAAHARFDVVRALREKGRDFSEDEKAQLVQVQREIVRSITSEWRVAQERGSVELTATPYYHPILPLVCDTDAAKVALPGVSLPPRLQAPDDAHEHVRRARAKFAQVFGREPAGMWPAEGSVSPEALAVFAAEGVSWVASDEEVLLRSLPGGIDRPAALYRPWRVAAGDREIAMVFRDRGLSDLIGFTYARQRPGAAVDDFLGHLVRIGGAAPRGGEPPLVSVILDGENPWEQYPDSGLHFLGELFGRLARGEAGIRTTTIGERVRRMPADAPRIEKIHSGSWIEASFRIWMGHSEDVAAWTLVHRTKAAIEERRAAGATADQLAAAREHLLAAQASDWFWWYGDDFVTESAAEFDALFRGHIVAAHRILGLGPPAAALSPISAQAQAAEEPVSEPMGFLRPRLDGVPGSWLDWQGAGLFRVKGGRGGAMHRGAAPFAAVHFGFDLERLYLRLDPAIGPAELPDRVDALRLSFRKQDESFEVGCALTPGDLGLRREDGDRAVGSGKFRAIVEVALSFAGLGLSRGDHVSFAIHALHGGVEVERIPRHGYLKITVPDEDFERVHWKV